MQNGVSPERYNFLHLRDRGRSTMTRGSVMRTEPRPTIAMIAAGAVAVAAAALCFLQYRSLVELAAKARVTAQDELLQTAREVGQRAEESVRRIGETCLAPFKATDSRAGAAPLGSRFDEIKRAHPEVEQVFLFSFDRPNGTSAILSGPQGAAEFT